MNVARFWLCLSITHTNYKIVTRVHGISSYPDIHLFNHYKRITGRSLQPIKYGHRGKHKSHESPIYSRQRYNDQYRYHHSSISPSNSKIRTGGDRLNDSRYITSSGAPPKLSSARSNRAQNVLELTSTRWNRRPSPDTSSLKNCVDIKPLDWLCSRVV